MFVAFILYNKRLTLLQVHIDNEEEVTMDTSPDPSSEESGGNTNQRRTLGAFMTPQANRQAINGGRYSSGVAMQAGEARRIAMDQTWRVNDIVVPERTIRAEIMEEDEEAEKRDIMASGGERQRQRLSEEERKVS
jgi:hypothetical protein